MTHLTQPIGLLGGTFDPVHYGHLRIALELQQACRLAEVRFIPCRQPVHRPPATATPEQRLAMLTRAIKNEPTFTIDECELQRNTPSYMVETIELLRDSLPRTLQYLEAVRLNKILYNSSLKKSARRLGWDI